MRTNDAGRAVCTRAAALAAEGAPDSLDTRHTAKDASAYAATTVSLSATATETPLRWIKRGKEIQRDVGPEEVEERAGYKK